jgi:hypothetical protein
MAGLWYTGRLVCGRCLSVGRCAGVRVTRGGAVVTDGEDTEASVIAVVTLRVILFTNPCSAMPWKSAP